MGVVTHVVSAVLTVEIFVVPPRQMEAVRINHASASSRQLEAVATIPFIQDTTLHQAMVEDVKRISATHLLQRRVLVLDVVHLVANDLQPALPNLQYDWILHMDILKTRVSHPGDSTCRYVTSKCHVTIL